jgi:hypothetical protein
MTATGASISGSISAGAGNIGGWSITNNEIGIGSGTNRVALNSSTPKIYVGNGTPYVADTGFYVDNTGLFTLGNQLKFQPSNGATTSVSTSAAFVSGSANITTTYDNSSSVILPGTLVTGSAIAQTNVRVASVSYGPSATVLLTYTYTGTNGTYPVSFTPDGFSTLTVNGTIRGAIDNLQAIQSFISNSGDSMRLSDLLGYADRQLRSYGRPNAQPIYSTCGRPW